METPKSTQSKTAKKGLHVLLCELSNDEDNATDTSSDVLEDPEQPWSQYFHEYINAIEQVLEGWSVIKWWGVCFLIIVVDSIATQSYNFAG